LVRVALHPEAISTNYFTDKRNIHLCLSLKLAALRNCFIKTTNKAINFPNVGKSTISPSKHYFKQ